MGHGIGFGLHYGAIAPNQLPKCRTSPFYLKACKILSRDSEAKMNTYKQFYARLLPSRLISVVSAKHIWSSIVANGAEQFSNINNL
jgi:hypothetical protein